MPIEIEDLKTAMKDDKGVKAFIQTVADAAVKEATSGLKSTNKELKEEKTKLQGILDKMPSTEELDEFKRLQTVLSSSEEAKLIADGKVDEVIAKRTEKAILDADKRVKDAEDKLTETQGQLGNVTSEFDVHRINNAIRSEGIKQGIDPLALDDVVSRANGVFSIDKDGSIVAVDEEGHVKTNEAGTAIDIKVFVSDLKEKAPHFWPGSVGVGLGGSGAGSEDSLIVAAEKGNTSGYIEGRRKLQKEKREAHLK